jgi:thiosulfate dehydrogenase
MQKLSTLTLVVLVGVAACGPDAKMHDTGSAHVVSSAAQPDASAVGASAHALSPAYHIPTDEELPPGDLGASVRRGREIVTRTFETLPELGGNGLHCTSCHLEGGTKANAGPWLGIPAAYPVYRARTGKQDTIEERVNDCFQRSLNGKPLASDGADMAAVVAYMRFISRDVPAGQTPGRGFPRIANAPTPNRAHGQELYMQRCAACHGADAAGQSPQGLYVFPPLAGPRSFNIAAGMARLHTAASFVRANMPLGQAGSLTEQEAYDVADYVIHLERPDFAGKEHDWPKGDKPADARY